MQRLLHLTKVLIALFGRRALVLSAAACLLYCCSAAGQTTVESYIQSQMNLYKIPGLAASIVKDGKLAWTKGFGYADMEHKVLVTPNTNFMLASISKTITATALLKEYEKGKIGLDDSINAYLPWPVRNPAYPDSAITFRQLLTHTSSISDNWDVLLENYQNGDSPIPLDSFLHSYLHPHGFYYNASTNFNTKAPGTFEEYSNVGAALIGYLVERISGVPFDKYCKDSIFDELCMDQTSWFLKDLDTMNVARPYVYYQGEYIDAGLYGYPDYPDGQLRTSAVNLARFMYTNLNEGDYNGKQLLAASTVNEMLSVQNPAVGPGQGLIWASGQLNGRTLWGHTGGDVGVTTYMYMDRAKNEGVIILTNGNNATLQYILAKLFNVADTISTAGKPDINCGLVHVSLNEKKANEQAVKVFPNPATDRVFISGLSRSSSIKLFTLAGQEVSFTQKLSAHQLSIDVSNLAKGVYLLVVDGKEKQRFKVVVSH